MMCSRCASIWHSGRGWRFWLWLVAVSWSGQTSVCIGAADTTVRIGALAYRGQAEALARWVATADYLSDAIDGYRFEIVPLDLDAMDRAVSEHSIDFLITNPGHYVTMEALYGISRVATLRNRVGDDIYTEFGAILFTRADREDIHSVADLRGKTLMAVSRDAFGGFQLAWNVLVGHGIDPFGDLAEIRYVGFPKDQIVYAVRDGLVDAGTVRTDTLERMAAEGLIELDTFKILDPRRPEGFSPGISSGLYPEWPFAKAGNTPDPLARQVAVALLTMDPDGAAAHQARSAGWTIPLDYGPVHELFRELHVGPYQHLGEVTFAEVLRQYAAWILLSTIVLITLAIFAAYVGRINHRLAQSDLSLRREVAERTQAQRELATHRDTLEERVRERTVELNRVNEVLQDDVLARERAERALRRSDATLRQLYEVGAETDLGHEQRLARLLAVGARHFNVPAGLIRRLVGGSPEIAASVGIDLSGISQECDESMVDILRASTEPMDIPDISMSNWKESPHCFPPGWRTYLAAPIVSGGSVHCLIEYGGPDPRRRALSDVDLDILRLMAQWVGGELERRTSQEKVRQHQEELAHVDRISTMGEMATGLAHELNQPLTAIVNYTGGCVRRLRGGRPDLEELGQVMDRAVSEATRAGQIISHLRDFMRKDETELHQVDLNAAVGNVLEMVDSEILRAAVSVETDFAPDLPAVSAREVQLEQVILNLVRNALDAMQSRPGDERRLRVRTRCLPDGIVQASIRDTGPGVEESLRATLFDAFVSGKPGGMGMGLSISRSIMESYGGSLILVPTGGEGAEFRFTLPGSDS